MIRAAVVLASLTLSLAASAHEVAFQQPDTPKTKPADRGAIIDRLRSNYQDVVERLNQNDPGSRTVAKQKEIADLLKQLLDENDSPNSDNSPPPSSPPPSAPPSSPKDSAPKPQKQNAEPMAEPMPATMQPTVEPKQSSAKATPPDSPMDLREKLKSEGHWPVRLPPRDRESFEAGLGERFMPRYEDLLRAYYRTIAESSHGKRGE